MIIWNLLVRTIDRGISSNIQIHIETQKVLKLEYLQFILIENLNFFACQSCHAMKHRLILLHHATLRYEK